MMLSFAALEIDPALETERLVALIRRQVFEELRRRGVVIGMSGGVDSSVAAALAARAVGPERVLGLALPEAANTPESLALAREWAARLGIDFLVEEIAPVLEAAGCYARQAAAIRSVFPDYDPGWLHKIVLGASQGRGDRASPPSTLNIFTLVVRTPQGELLRRRLPAPAYLDLVAATNFKQRVRKMFEYHQADRRQYAVLGTSNRLEYEQGFFVKQGDGAADLKPLAHLYKSQVYQLATFLGVPEAIVRRLPTTETYPLEQTQEEFFFGLPYPTADLVLYALNEGHSAGELATALGCSVEAAAALLQDMERRRITTRYLRLPPLTIPGLG